MRRRISLLGLALMLLLPGAAGIAPPVPRGLSATEWLLSRDADATPSTRLLARAARAWSGGAVTASTGATLTVYVSDSYPPGQVAPQTWADFFASLIHGSELSLLVVYVAPPAEVQAICRSSEAFGCYGGNRLVVPGEPVEGVSPEDIARHEYGHHVAEHRSNPPWRAVEWGPKRWASYANVCSRAEAGSAFPGDETANYRLNPGEGFAESYRLLNDLRAGAAAVPWLAVDASFFPDLAALQAVEQDVVQPWTAPGTKTFSGRAAAETSWTLPLSTPLDGTLTLVLKAPRAALFDLSLLGPDNRVLAEGALTGTSTKRLGFEICGQRTLSVRVTALGAFSRFSLQVSQP